MITRLLALSLAASVALAGRGDAQQKKTKHDRNLITLEELAALQGQNGYEVVEKLRPDWLRRSERRVTLNTRRADRGTDPRGGQGPAEEGNTDPTADVTPQSLKLMVFVDQTEIGGVEELQRLRNDDIQEIRFLNSSDAQQRYGPRFAAGVIQVKLKSS
jgi:hypothetical protein